MIDENAIVRARQHLIRMEMDQRGILVKQVQIFGGWDTPSTVTSYFPADRDKEPQTMSVAALYRLLDKDALPADVISLLLPERYSIVEKPKNIDHDAVASWCIQFLNKWNAAKHPESEAGTETGPKESSELLSTIVRLQVVS